MQMNRRLFLQSSLLVGSGLLLGCTSSSKQILSVTEATDHSLGVWLRISSDGTITFVVPSAEMGQGVTTSLTTIVAEELDVDYKQIQAVHAPANSEYDNPEFGLQGTGGSTSVLAWWEPLKLLGAGAKTMLVNAAAQRWKVHLKVFALHDSCWPENEFWTD